MRSAEYNLDLSERRAAAVMKYLMDHGIAAERLTSRGYGETTLLEPNAESEEQHARNRRVQFKILDLADGAPIVKEVEEAEPTVPEE